MRYVALLIVLFAIMAGQVKAQTNPLDTLRQTYQKQEQTLLDGYGKALDLKMSDLKKKGDLDTFLVVETEKKRFDAEKTVPSLSDAKESFKLAAGAYSRARQKSLNEYVAAIDALIRSEMMADRIDNAKVAKAEKEKVAAELAGLEAKTPKEPVVEKVSALKPKALESSKPSASASGKSSDTVLYAEKFNAKFDGWFKGKETKTGAQAQNVGVGIAKVSGKMGSPAALRIVQKNTTGEMETRKTFPLAESTRGHKLAVEAVLGYNFVNEYVGTSGNSPGGKTWAGFEARLLNRRGEVLEEKHLSKHSQTGGDLVGAPLEMENNRLVFDLAQDSEAVSVLVAFNVNVSAPGSRPPKQTCMSELWIKSMRIVIENDDASPRPE